MKVKELQQEMEIFQQHSGIEIMQLKAINEGEEMLRQNLMMGMRLKKLQGSMLLSTTDEEGTNLGILVYEEDGAAFQTFKLPNPAKGVFRYVKLQIGET
ncbi:hypothetical protein PFLUV_G00017870 [Perca fluviatilis]|uniref:SUN domain-containing protein n=1 Tax=Perca fluviatilis TaxID=8168 RepID=A0A6A5FP68_PERFL|nr:hypothetical protein PFLUV_G00017870 [Perca fluviatilis]